jgi:type I restriction enzyme, S subunit
MASEAQFTDLSDSLWPILTLRELIDKGDAELQTGPFGTMLHAKAYRSSGVPVVAVKNIGDNRLLDDDIPRVDTDTAHRLERYQLLEGDIVFGRKGAVDRRALVKADQVGWLQGSDCIRLRLNQRNINPRFVSFVLGSPYHRSWIIQQAHGATMPSLNQEILSRLPLPMPEFDEQQNIAKVLGALDDKIELNRKMNETLEAMARALFKSWFIDFEPVRAKSEGRDSGLSALVAALFSNSFEESSLDEIPTGWTAEPIGNLTEVIGGTTPSTKEPEYWEPDIHAWATPKDLSDLQTPVLLKTERRISDKGLVQIGSGWLPVGTILLSSRAPIGYLAVAEIPVAINQGFIAMKPKEGVSNLFLLYWAEVAQETIKSRANGSTFLEISKSNFRQIQVVRPDTTIMKKFDAYVRPWYERIVINEHESSSLTALRETLLPKLISGEVRIKPVAE